MPECADLETRARAYLCDRFGVRAEDLTGIHFARRRDELWATTVSSTPDAVSIRPPGLRAMRSSGGQFKPTSAFLRVLGAAVRCGRVDVGLSDLRQLLLGRTLATDSEDGYVALVYERIVIGCGHASRGGMRCLLPTSQRKGLLDMLPEARQ